MSAIPGNAYPTGWFVIAWSHDLEPGAVKAIQYFGQQLVLFRTESGDARVLDAYCPHLGAHLGHGGEVKGDNVVCPFHAWEFDGTGACKHIPYSHKKIPKNAKVRPWHVQEKSGIVFLWHDTDGRDPLWELTDDIAKFDREDWTGWYYNHVKVKTHPREIIENVADSAHFPVVHRTDVDHFENIYDGHKASQHTIGTAVPPNRKGKDSFDIFSTYHGPGFQLSDMKGYLHSFLFLAHTPIDTEHLDLRFCVKLEKAGPRTEDFAAMYVENLTLGFHEDIEIWENKLYRDVPRLVDGDGPIGKLRRWYSQFYKSEEQSAAK